MWWDYDEELHLKNVWQMGYEEGLAAGRKESWLLDLVIKKVRRNKSLKQVADALEEDPEALRPIYEAVVSAAPDYDADMIYNQLKK